GAGVCRPNAPPPLALRLAASRPDLPDGAAWREAALAKLWAVLRWFAPHQALATEPADAWLARWLPAARAAADAPALARVVRAALAPLRDSHAYVAPPSLEPA